MSDVADRAQVSIEVADFANQDAAGKTNVLGAGVSVLGFDPIQGVTARFAVIIRIRVPADLLPAEYSHELALYSGDDHLVSLPGPAGPQALRLAQPVSMPATSSQLVPIPAIRDYIDGTHVMVLDFGSGLPLSPGATYEWRSRIDGDDTRVVTYRFGVTGPQPGIVIG